MTGPGRGASAAIALAAVAGALPAIGLAVALFVPGHLPFVDLPQHVALVSIWSHLADPARALSDRYVVNVATPYATGYLLAHLLAPLTGDEGAVRIVLFASLIAIPLATVAVLRAYGRPPELAIVGFAVAFSWVTFMGFFEFIVALPLVIASVAVTRYLGLSRWATPVLGILGIVTFATHAFALPMLILVFLGAAVGPGWSARLGRGGLALAPAVALAGLWAVGRARTPSPDPMPFSMGSPLTRLAIPRYLFGSDVAEPRVIALSGALLLLVIGAAIIARREQHANDPRPMVRDEAGVGRVRGAYDRAARLMTAKPLLGPTTAAAMGYLLTPSTALDSYGLWQRFAPVAFVLGVGLLPWPSAPRRRVILTAALVLVTTASSLATLDQSAAFDRQIAGLDTVIQGLPAGQRVFYVEPDLRPAGVGVAALRHLEAEYVVLRGGDTSYNFTMFPHLVVRDRLSRTLANESTSYDIELRFVGDCTNVPQRAGTLLERAGGWRAWSVVGPLVRPPSRPLDSLPVTAAC